MIISVIPLNNYSFVFDLLKLSLDVFSKWEYDIKNACNTSAPYSSLYEAVHCDSWNLNFVLLPQDGRTVTLSCSME